MRWSCAISCGFQTQHLAFQTAHKSLCLRCRTGHHPALLRQPQFQLRALLRQPRFRFFLPAVQLRALFGQFALQLPDGRFQGFERFPSFILPAL